MYEGYNILTTSKVINNYFTKYYLKSILKDNNIKKYPSNNLAVMTIKYFVPNVSDLSFEDILKIRYKAKDELIAYRTYMDDMNNKITGDLSQSEVYEYTNNIIENKIQPSITDLQRKISSANIRVGQTFLDEIKDISSYTPILGSLITNLPIQLSLLVSAGIISAKTLLKAKEEKNILKSNGLYYLYDLSSITKKK
jgi:hypothetical protein